MRDISSEEILTWDKLVKLVIKKHYYASDILDEEDLYNIGLTGVWKALRSYDENKQNHNGTAKLKNYVFIVVFNEIGSAVGKINNRGKDEMRSKLFSIDSKIDDTEQDTFHEITEYDRKVLDEPDDIFISEEVESHLAHLTEEEREIVIHKINGYSVREIADKMGSNRTTVNNKYRRSLEKMYYNSEYKNYNEIYA